uniref:nuclear RNA export factor 1-like n=1 Tax=Styela clava TaxID=7725 RepID=UPI00193A2E78|nr:nuclear RNA export factor 1-like [Styela clava]
MSYRGRSRNNYNKRGSYSYRGDYNNKYSQHDNRSGSPSYNNRDKESGESYNDRQYSNDRYEPRGRGGGKFRGRRPNGRFSARRGSRGRGGSYRGRGGRGDFNQNNHIDPDGDIDMEGGTSTGKARPAPYARPSRDNRPPRGNPRFHQNNRNGPNWSLVTIVQGAMLDREWLIEAIQKEIMVQIKPVQYFHDGENSQFCIEDAEVAQNIRDCNRKITGPDGNKLLILKTYCSPPITDDQLVILRDALSKRYNTDTLHLDASDLYSDKTLRENRIDMKLKFSKAMYILINIIGEHISGLLSLDLSNNRMDNLSYLKNLVVVTPRLKCLKLERNELRHSKELDNIREWDLTELNIDGNPLCQHFESQSDYISAIRDKFPNLQVLDGKKLPPPVKFDLEKVTKLVPAIPNHIPPAVTEIIKQFVKQYFALYDTNRENLSQAYDENCMFSLTIPSNPRGAPLTRYLDYTRNLRRLKNAKLRLSYLRKSRSEICETLKKLPKTEHDISGFCVDVPLVSPTMIKFIIRGVFKEKHSGKDNSCMRAFTRAFLCLTDGARLSIINEEIHIRNTTIVEYKSAFAKPPVTPSPSPVPEQTIASPAQSTSSSVPTVAPVVVGSPSKLDMVAAFCKESGMNAGFSEQCLNENGWDYMKAGQAFLSLKNEGKIPAEAFVR